MLFFHKKPFSLATLKNIKHKTKKSLMLKAGQTKSEPEEPDFLHLLSTLTTAKNELQELYNTSRRVAVTGLKFNKNIEKLCGFNLRSEGVFNKDAEFLITLKERVSTELGRIVDKDINDLDEAIVQYKTARLKFDALHFKTVKKMRKEGKTVTVENADDVMNASQELRELNVIYLASKVEVRRVRDIIISHLKKKVRSRLQELREVSDAPHHLLYCKYFEERLKKTVEICGEEPGEEVHILRRSNTFSHHRSNPSNLMQKSYDSQINDMRFSGNMQPSSFFEENKSLKRDDVKGAEDESIEATENPSTESQTKQEQVEAAMEAEKHQQALAGNS